MKRLLKRISFLVVIVVASVWLAPDLVSFVLEPGSQHGLISQAYQNKRSNLLVEADARVVRLLPDLEDLGRYQEFNVELPDGHVLRIQHNLDEAPRVPVGISSRIRVRGEYDWSGDGGVIHWTHDDPTGQREGGWIEYQGEKYF